MAAATKVKLSKERAWKEFGERLDDDFKTANKVFWQTIRRLRGKRSRAALFIDDSNGVTLKDQDAILNRWREYFSDLLNPVDATPIQIHEEQVEGRYSDNRSRCECSNQIIENWKSTW